ncbi:hypothetical protein [Chitinophaga sp.]|uniref:hypothetical protein n=1 Tax=Chitinophaga sp. TaxID=1869181 RepID=UPI002F92D781
MKIWINPLKGEDKIIAHLNDMIYKCNPKAAEVNTVAWGLEQGVAPDENMFNIPLHYINEVRWEEGKQYIQVFFRGSEEHLTIYDEAKRREIFDYFRTILPSFSSTTIHQTAIEAGKKTLIAMGVVSVLLVVSLYFSAMVESGVEYEIRGRAGLLAAVVGIASLGTKKVLLIYGSLLAITGISFARKAKQPRVIHKITK